MKNLFFILLSISSFSQKVTKPQYLFDENEQLITKEEVINKRNDIKIDFFVYETDTAFIGRFFKKKDLGLLSSSNKIKIYKELKIITKQEIDTSKLVIINFYYKENYETKGCCIDHYTTDLAYQNYIKKNNITQFFITEKDYYYNSKNVYQDKNDVIRSILFKYEFFTMNYIIIKPNGSFYRELGEYDQDQIPKNLNSF